MKKFFLFFLFAVIFFAIGALVGYFIPQKAAVQTIDSNNTFQAGWKAAEKRLVGMGFLQEIPVSQAIYSVGGKIISTKGKTMEIKITPLEPLADPELDNREISINDQTKIFKYSKKEEALYKRELDEYYDKVSKDVNFDDQQALMPVQYELKEANSNDLVSGLTIEVKSKNDLKTLKKIIADEITVQI
jgi:hypothetical protein